MEQAHINDMNHILRSTRDGLKLKLQSWQKDRKVNVSGDAIL
jgi:hypothetical protein